MCRKENPCTPLVEMRTGTATVENSVERSQEIKISFWVFIQGQRHYLERCLYPHFHCSILHNSQGVDTSVCRYVNG